MPSVFLSHSHGDKAFVRGLADRLTQAGAVVWLDEAALNIGDSLIERISEAIQEMEYVAAILSPRSVKSNWVQKELSTPNPYRAMRSTRGLARQALRGLHSSRKPRARVRQDPESDRPRPGARCGGSGSSHGPGARRSSSRRVGLH